MKKRLRFTKAKRELARILVKERIDYFNQFYHFKVGRISIRNQRTRWGSCSSKGNLNFNYKVIYLKKDLVNYLIVHELCHLGQLNHSKKFWDLVAKTIPDFKKTNKELKMTSPRAINESLAFINRGANIT